MKRIIFLLAVVFTVSCVKDPESGIDINALAEVQIDSTNNFTLSANPEKLYKITFRAKTDDGEISNETDVKFTISKGTLINSEDLSDEGASLTVQIKNRVAIVFYRPDSDAATDIQLIAMVGPFTMIKRLSTVPVLPTEISFEHPIYSANNAAPLDLSVFLKADSAKVSSGLQVNLTYQTIGITPTTTIINVTPSTAISTQSSTEPFSKVSSRIENVSQQTDTVLLIARFNNVPMDTATIYFHE